MARPSMVEQRRTEILDALEECILKQGLQDTSLENIADTAGVKRTILRHYIGNRDQIITALSERWRNIYSDQWLQAISQLPETDSIDTLLEMLFYIGSTEDNRDNIISHELFSESKRLEPVKLDQEQNMAEFIKHCSQILASEYPHANSDDIELVCYGIYANYLTSKSMLLLNLHDVTTKLIQSSKRLCDSLAV
ncbi:TetR/AcrR family transcriptional regulator [Parashewanella curva]|uniref:TetR/AcrR family transcriptional regulator n=1 Tax=Parashewanella curva TaxID=2338552 RepID=A0A3L8Q2P8_9GAMM|nr:TetR/AcrR family transcriptional regulator [Parashewanella curva]RLV61299.1 TetR/AcrR family transcriptional regulator [Parashewanella curva]